MNFKLINKFLSFSIGTWIGAFLGIIEVPILTRFIQPDDLGKASMYAMGLNIFMIFTLFGIDQACMRFYYEDNAKKLLKNSLLLTFLVFIVGLIVLYIFRIQISYYLFEIYSPLLIFLIGFGTILYVLYRYGLLIFQMEQNGFLYSVLQVGFRFIQLALLVFFIFIIGREFTSIIFSRFLTLFVIVIVTLLLLRKTWREKMMSSNRQSNYSIKDIFYFSFPLALSGIVGLGLQSFDKMAIKQWSTYHELGIYVSAFTIVSMMQIIQASFTTYWAPLSLERFAINGDNEANKIFFEKSNAIVSAFMLIIAVAIIMGKDIIVLILGDDYRFAASIIPFLVIMPLMTTISETTVMGINFYYKVKWHLYIALIIGLVNLLCNYLLVPFFGGKGAAISIGVSYIVFFILRTHISLKYFKLNFHLKKFYFLMAIVVFYALYSTFFDWNFFNTIFGLLIIVLIGCFYYRNLKIEALSLIINKKIN